MSLPRHLHADLLLVIVTLIAASGWIFTKEALAGFPPLLFMGIRFLLAGLIVAAFSPQPVIKIARSVPKEQLHKALGVGLIFSVAMMLWVLALSLGDHVGEGAFITSLWSVLVPLIGGLLYRSPILLQHRLAMMIAFLGLLLLLIQDGLAFNSGQMLFACSAIFLALYFAMNSAVSAQTSAFLLTSIQLSVVGVLCLLVSGVVESWPASIASEFWWWLALSTVVATSLRFFLQTYAQGKTTANHAALIMTLEPVWAALFSMSWFHESMTYWQLLGCSLIFVALIVGRWKSTTKVAST